MEESNIKAMREAFANISEYAKAAACHTEESHLLGYLNQIERWAESALSAPPRNCDVGTAEEQFKRFNMFCFPIKCRECKLYTEEDLYDCIFRWLQLPYEKGGAK